jgi:hypothetical protein
MRKRLILSIIFSLNFLPYLYPCVGSRPLSMGGAFVGVADDVNATYWNPAGLARDNFYEFTYTPTLYDRDEVNYDDFVALKIPLSDWGAIGLSFIDSGYDMEGLKMDDKFYWVSYSNELIKGLFGGLNLRFRTIDIESTYLSGSDEAFEVDLATLWEVNDSLSLGLLLQDVNEPMLLGAREIMNVRPGLAFRFKDTLFSFEVYDAMARIEGVPTSIRLGIEHRFKFPEEKIEFALRAGGYNLNNQEENLIAFTLGAGLEGWVKDKKLSFDLALLYWTGLEEVTVFLGFKVSIPLGKEILKEKEEVRVYPTIERFIEREIPKEISKKPPRYVYIRDKETYFDFVRRNILNSIRIPYSINTEKKAQLLFTLTKEGQLKNVLLRGEDLDYALRESIIESIRGSFFPEFPEDIRKQELKFTMEIIIQPR